MPQAQTAKYTVQIPTHDNLGNPLGNISTAAHEWLWRATGVQGTQIHGPIRGNWRDHGEETYELLTSYAPDTPEMDSHVKQLAQEIARGANQWGVFVTKEGGKSGVQSWVIENPHYVEGQPAELAQLQPKPDLSLAA